MAKLCPKGKAAAKRKFKVYPSAYANMYASKVCKGKVRASAKDGGNISDRPKLKRLDARTRYENAIKSKQRRDKMLRERERMGGHNSTPIVGEASMFKRLKAAADKQDRKEGKPKSKSYSKRPPRTKFKASGGRINMKSGGLAKRGQGCEIR